MRGCAVSVLGGFKKQTGYISEHLDLVARAAPALGKSLDQKPSEVPFILNELMKH